MEMSEMETGSSAHEKSRVLGVIVLTDNRQHLPSLKHPSPSLRCSAFTQPSQPARNEYEQEVIRLAQRVSALQQRICELSHLESVSQACRQTISLKKKQRRKFKDLVRDQQCPICQKSYGSETSLKYHLKLKHARNDQNHSQSN